MEQIETAARMLAEKLGLDIDPARLTEALSGLLGDGQGRLDIAGLVSRMTAQGDLGSIVQSWLGDGANAGISADRVMSILGENKVAEFAQKVGTDTRSAAEGLSGVIPQLIDKASSGGNLLESAGGLGGLMGAAKGFFNK